LKPKKGRFEEEREPLGAGGAEGQGRGVSRGELSNDDQTRELVTFTEIREEASCKGNGKFNRSK